VIARKDKTIILLMLSVVYERSRYNKGRRKEVMFESSWKEVEEAEGEPE
jgi:hypothetical protein